MVVSKTYFRIFAITFLLFQLLAQITFSQNIAEIVQPMCKNRQIKYTILADMITYFDKENNIDGREFYNDISDLFEKKVGTFSILDIDESYENVIKYKNYDQLLSDLRKHKLDGILVDSSTANYTQSFTNDLSLIQGSAGIISPAFVTQKDSQIFKDLTEYYTNNEEDLYYIFYKWMGINDDGFYINKTLTGTNGLIKAMCINLPPFTFPDENGELVGLEVEALYKFARLYGYQLEIELKDVSSVDEINALKDGSINITSFLIQDIDTSIFSTLSLNEIEIQGIVRYSNLPDSINWTVYDGPKDFNGEKLGCITGSSFGDLYKKIFPDSEIKYYKDNFDAIYDLLLEEIEGFINDEVIAQKLEKKYPERLTYYDLDSPQKFGFGFKKIKDNPLIKGFNEFLEKIDKEKLFEKWNVDNTFNINVEKNNFQNGDTIKVGFLLDAKPFAYKENGEAKGYEIDLLYQFAKYKNYSVDLVELSSATERMNLNDYEITGGSFTINEERANNISFSNPIFQMGTSFVVRTDSKKDKMKLTLYDKEYNEIPDNTATINAKIGDKTVTSKCVFPNIFNDTFSINCTINDFKGTDPYTQGIEYINTTDKIKILYSELEIDNILKANDKLNLPIITESNKTEHICSGSSKEGIFRKIASIGGVVSLIIVLVIALKFCF